MSDLQCAARLLITAAGAADGAADGDEVGVPARSLADSRVAAVYADAAAASARTADTLAAGLGLPVRTVAELAVAQPTAAEPAAADPGAAAADPLQVATAPERSSSLGARELPREVRAAWESIADLHRGETVLVVVDEPVLRTVVPQLVRNPRTDGPESAEPVLLVEADADGWMVRPHQV